MHATRKSDHTYSGLRAAAASASALTLEEEQQLGRAARRGDGRAFERLVRAHLRLVLAIAAEHRRFGVALDDLVAEGMVGLVIAARRFDPECGTRLAVYAAFWIRALMRRFTLANRRIVGAPSTRKGRQLLANLTRTERELTEASGAAPNREQLAQHLGVSPQEIAETELALRGRDAAVSCAWPREPDSVEPIGQEPSPELALARAERQREIELLLARALARLPAREREIVKARRLALEAPSLTELGRTHGISGERVRQLENSGLAQLRDAVLEASA